MYSFHIQRAVRRLSSRLLSGKSANVKKVTDKFNAEIACRGVVPGFKLAAIFQDRIAIQDPHGEYTYKGLFNAAKGLSNEITKTVGGKNQLTVAYLCPGDSSHILTQWAIWMSGNIAVPLSPQHPPPLLEYFLQDSGAALVICDQQLLNNLPKSNDGGAPIITLPETLRSGALLDTLAPNPDSAATGDRVNLDGLPDGNFYANSDALILYTSGTTSKPKGVVYGFRQLTAQVASLHEAWQYRSSDVLLHVLPLHHIHGQINSVTAGLAAGAIIRMLPAFSPSTIWSHLLGMKKRDSHRVSVLMGVPTMYSKLIQEYEKVFATNNRHKEYIKSVLKTRMRLMISGSAPLPTPIFQQWEDISGHRLLERYGMTEIGMALSNPYEPMKQRTPGAVGIPLPGVTVRISSVDPLEGVQPLVALATPPPSFEINLTKLQFHSADSYTRVKNLFTEETPPTQPEIKCSITYEPNVNKKEKLSGELFVKGAGIFSRYWKRPEQTKEEFSQEGWFKTGDTAMLDDGIVRILGRTSVDIIKSGGYKISALDVETLVLGHPAVADAAVLGLPDHTWGENVAAVIELKKGESFTLKELQEWGAQFVPKYQVPTMLYIIPKIPRNAMGKVNKKELRQALLNQKPNNL